MFLVSMLKAGSMMLTEGEFVCTTCPVKLPSVFDPPFISRVYVHC